MKKGFDFISQGNNFSERLREIEENSELEFPERFKTFVREYSFSSESIILEMKKDELRGFEFPAEAILFEPSKEDYNPLYFSSFRDLDDIEDELKSIKEDELWLEKGLIVIGYSTVGEKICLGVKSQISDEIWRVNDDSTPQDRFKFLANDIYLFVEGLVSKKQ